MYKQLQTLLVLFTLLFSFGKLSARTCDENISKALGQTRVITFSKVTQAVSGDETLNFQATNLSLNCKATGQLRFQIQNATAGRTYTVELIETPATYTGTRTFTITESDKEGAVSFVKLTGYNMPAGNYKAKLHTSSVANSQPVPATIGKLQRDFPAPNRSNNDFGNDQVYRDIQSGGSPDCGYMTIRYSGNTNSPFYKYFNTPELLALYEYTAYSDDDLANKYGGNRNHPNIVWRDIFSVPTGKTSAQKMIYYDLQAHNRTYKDLKEDPLNKAPKFYFRIKGQNCNNNNNPMEAGDMRFMNTGIVFGGTCKAPEMSVTAENQIVCYPVTYVIKHNGLQVSQGQINGAGERKGITTLDNGQPFKADQQYEVIFTSVDGQTATRKESYNTFYNAVRPGGGYTQETRCFGDTRTPKGRIEVLFRVNQSGSILPMNGFKVTLEQAPAGYVDEPGKLKLNETVTITYRKSNSLITNIMATQNQDDLTQNFSLPEGTYKIRVEDPCGKVTYVYSGLDSTKEEFKLVFPSYQEKPLTPEVETECTKVIVYPFKNNPAFDWLKINNEKKNIYVYLFKRPTGITDGDIAVSSNLSEVIGGTRYVKAVFKPNEANSHDQYFSLPRNQNSEGSYTFVYGVRVEGGREEQDLIRYISSNGTNGCVRTFTISVDDVLLNFDRDSYIGYKCEDNTGKIVIKAINGISGTGTYQYELYDHRDGTRIHTQTAAKGSTVTFTNLGTFTAGQNSRWVKITDSACASEPVWKELPITPLDNPQLVLASPLQTAYCKGATVTITLRSLGAPSYQWKYPDGTTTVTTLPQLVIPSIDAQHAGIYQVVAQGLVCAANTVTFSYTVNILEAPATGKTYTLCAAATVADLKAKIATDTATVKVYKNGTLVTDNTEALSTTDTYKVSRFNAVCETDKVVVTIVFSNTVTLTVPTALTVTCTTTNIDTVVSNWLNQATVTDTCGTATLTHNFTAVKPTNWCGAGVVTVTFVARDPQGNTVTKTSVIKVNITPLVATPDTDFTFPSGSVTDTSTRTVIDNDRIGNRTPTTSDVIITTGTTTTDVVGQTNTPTIDTTTGKVTIPSGTKSGTYTLTYTICERLNPDNCKTTTVTVKVGSTPLVATPDTDFTFPSGSVTDTSTRTVIDNDRIGNRTPTTSDVIITTGTTTTDVVGQTNTPTIDTTTGKVMVPSGTKSGTYTLTYTICERLNPDNCKTTTVTVKVGSTPLVATPDTDFTFPSGSVTDTSTRTVIDNDRIGNRTPTTSDVIITTGTTTTDVVGQTNTPTIDTTTGKVTVPSGTKSGTYTLTYTICERLNPDNCKTTTVTVKVGSTPLVATPDTDFTFPSGSVTDTSTRTVIDNDRIGNRTPTTSDVIITTGTTTTDVVGQTNTPTIDTTTGKVTVPSGTKSGTYTLTYTICERLNPDNCKTTTVTVKVGSTPLVAMPDTDFTFPSGSVTDTSTRTVIDNDRIGNRTPTTSDVIITTGTTTTDVVGQTNTPTIDTTTGKVTVPSGTKSGTYTLTYTICERLNPDNCKTTTVTVKVGSTPLVATPDTDFTFPSGSATSTSTRTVIDNDRIGNRTPTTSDVVITTGTTTTDVVGQTNTPTIDTTTGKVTVPSGTKSGTYTLTYTICERLNPDNCKTTTVTVKVGSTPLVATPDTDFTFPSGSVTDTSTRTVIDNDRIGNRTPTTSDVIITTGTTTTDVVGQTNTPTIDTTTGKVTVPSGTKSGTYTLTYTICERLNPDNCKTTTVTVKVGSTPLVATPDTDFTFPSGSVTDTSTRTVIDNDRIGNRTPTTSDVIITTGTTTTDVVGQTNTPTIDTTTGKVTVPSGTKSGTYTLTYTICERLNPDNCKTTTVTVKVGSTPLVAMPDTDFTFPSGSVTDTSTRTVIDNDRIGNRTPTTSDVIITTGTTTTDVVGQTNTPTIDTTTGKVTVPSGTKSGTYTLTYTICERLNPDNCKTTTVTVKVGSTPLVATPDTDFTFPSGSVTDTSTRTVIDNDRIGNRTPTTSDVIITTGTTTTDVVGQTNTPTIDTTTGKVTVPSGTKSGTYTLTYTICERLNPDNCKTTTVTVKVGSTPLVAMPDTDFTFPSGSVTDTSTRTVIDNDRIGNRTPTTSDVIITTGTTTTDVVGQTNTPTIDTTTGKVTVPSGTKSGTYTLTYTICERLNPDNCKTTTVTVKVGSTPLVAMPDTDFTFPSGSVTDTSTRTVIDNDRIGNRTPTTSDVIITTGTTTTDVVGQTNTPTIDTTTGKVTVPSGTKSGTYTLTYTICERLNPDNCKTTTVTVKVGNTTTPTTIEANDDVATVSSTTGGTTSSVLTNDKLNGVPNPSVSSVTLTWNTATPTGFTLNPNGTITVAPNTPAGTYTISYKICAVASSTVCDTANIVVTITGTTTSTTTPTTIEANDDVATVSSTTGGTTSSVLTNDKLNGALNPSVSSVTLTWNTATPTGFTLNPNGTITVAPNTPAGTYTISYKICAVASSTVCDTADIVVTVTGTTTSTTTPTTIEANDDGVTTITSTTGGTTSSVLTNDKLNGVPNPSVSSVTLTWTTATPTGFSLNPNGTITIAPNTPAGTYTISYKICAVASPTVCDNANIVVTVTGTTTSTTTPTTIEANDDVATVSSTTGGTTSSVLTNDKLNGVLNPSVSSVTLTWTTATPTGFTLNPNGTITVAPNTPAGTYTISYKICAVASSTVCDTADIVVTVTGTTTSTTPVLPIVADDRTTTPIDTPVVVNVLANDTPNGATAPNVVTNPTNGTTVVNPDSTIEYRPHTGFEGIDTFVYELCNNDGCASATVTIEVISKLIPYNGMSVDDDGKNEHFHIGGINRYPDNVVRIYNRWGVKVFEAEGYDNVTRVFRGFSNGRVVVETSDKLPQGTYYYVIEYVDENKQKRSEVGWLYIKR
ncbi:gliding motility-associated C-terminal domain-containing protein [Capnocytophaga leadbetteri]